MEHTARTVALLLASVAAGLMLQGCGSAKSGYKIKEKNVYSNSKYLADFQEDMSLDKCKKLCSSWGDRCKDVCEKDKNCGLSDDADARHFTRSESCSKKCAGFNVHHDGHCTLFASNVELLSGGHGTFYIAEGASLRGTEESDGKTDEHESDKSDKIILDTEESDGKTDEHESDKSDKQIRGTEESDGKTDEHESDKSDKRMMSTKAGPALGSKDGAHGANQEDFGHSGRNEDPYGANPDNFAHSFDSGDDYAGAHYAYPSTKSYDRGESVTATLSKGPNV